LYHNSRLRRLARGTAPLALALGMMAAPAYAQEAAPAAPQDNPAVADEGDSIVVTGSLFRRTDTETPSPVTVLTADSLAKAGITSITDAVRSISADNAGSISTGFSSGFSAGGAAVSLRGLGVSSTLVIVDGLRSANFPLNDDGHNAYVDLNSIPFSLVDRVEVLKDGASSTYGADAIGGVVNLILKKQFKGIAGLAEGGVSGHNDARRYRGNLTVGFGDYAEAGWNVYLNGEYQRDGRVTAHSRGFPFNTQDLRAIGGADLNNADASMTVASPTAYVTRVGQTNLNDPFAGAAGAAPTGQFQALNLNCPNGTFTSTTAGAQGTGCKYDLADMYGQIQPLQQRWSVNGRASLRISDTVEAYVTGSYSNSFVSIIEGPRAIRANQPFGGAATLSTINPGVVLPVYVCAAGTNCATATDRRLNPNNPYAAAYANDPANGAARIYYLFGDIKAGSERRNEVFRGTAGLNGTIGEDWDWRVEAVAAKDNMEITQFGYLNVNGLKKAINTGAYNFVNPSANTDEVRRMVAPDMVTPSESSMTSLDASVTKQIGTLAGGPLQLALGGQIRRETLINRNQNADLQTLTLTTSSAFGKRTVAAGYFELDAPLLKSLELNVSGRYDHYSEGFSRFSPKLGMKFTPAKQVAIRGTYSQGFRAPTFAEFNPASSYAGFSGYTPPANFVAAHGGSTNPYAQTYNAGQAVQGNPNLKPEKSRSFTAGLILQPAPWFSFTIDYYNVKKSDLIVAGALLGEARAAYYSKSTLAEAKAAVEAIGPGYSVNLVDAVDPLFPTALPRLLIINSPYVNAKYSQTSGIDFSATATVPLAQGIKWISRIEATDVIQYDLHTETRVQKFAGTLGPYELSSGNGTPKWRGNWQNTLDFGSATFSATAYWVGRIKSIAPDERVGRNCATSNQYQTGNATYGNKFCYVSSFINVDLNASAQIGESITIFGNIGNVLNARAPIAPASYSSSPNRLVSWHYAGLIGRTFRAGASFRF